MELSKYALFRDTHSPSMSRIFAAFWHRLAKPSFCSPGSSHCDDDARSWPAASPPSRTLPSNLALCVHPELEYVNIRDVQVGSDSE